MVRRDGTAPSIVTHLMCSGEEKPEKSNLHNKYDWINQSHNKNCKNMIANL